MDKKSMPKEQDDSFIEKGTLSRYMPWKDFKNWLEKEIIPFSYYTLWEV